MIYETVPGNFVISSGGTWLPGAYDSKAAAQYAFQFTYSELEELNLTRGVGGSYRLITVDDLREVKKNRRE